MGQVLVERCNIPSSKGRSRTTPDRRHTECTEDERRPRASVSWSEPQHKKRRTLEREASKHRDLNESTQHIQSLYDATIAYEMTLRSRIALSAAQNTTGIRHYLVSDIRASDLQADSAR